MVEPFWKIYPIDIEVKVCEIHYRRLKNLITGGIPDEEGECRVKRCHARAAWRITIRVQQGEKNVDGGETVE